MCRVCPHVCTRVRALIINFYQIRTLHPIWKSDNSLDDLWHIPRSEFLYAVKVWYLYLPYSDVIMSVMAFQITGVSIVCTTVCSGADQMKTSKPCVTGLCERNPPVTGGFPSQRASNAKMFVFDDVIMLIVYCRYTTYRYYIHCTCPARNT